VAHSCGPGALWPELSGELLVDLIVRLIDDPRRRLARAASRVWGESVASEMMFEGEEPWLSSCSSAGRAIRLSVMEEKINLAEKLALVNEYWSAAIVGRLNDYKIQVVKVKGEFSWHTHAGTDEFFLVLEGELAIRLRDREVRLNAGEVFVVPRGVEHCPFAETDCQLLVIEPSGTVNTGEAGGDLTTEERSI